jgi:hypothetical protein
VFEEQEEAVEELLELIHDRHSTVPDNVLQDLINRLKQADRVLALVAISDAIARNGDRHDIREANRELERGDNARKPDEAIEHYGDAWKSARRA